MYGLRYQGPFGEIITDPNRKVVPREPLNVLDEDFLYAKGKELRIHTHRPPRPFGSKSYASPFDVDECHSTQDELNSRCPSDHVFLKLPRDRAEDSRAPDSAKAYLDIQEDVTSTLVVTHILKAGDERGAQVVLCDIKESESLTTYWNNMGHKNHPKQVIAKIYDPLFYPKDHPIEHGFGLILAADAEYAREAASYMEFHDNMYDPMVRDFVPRFYGTWTTLVENEAWGSSTTRPIPGTNDIQTVRPVRMVLMEYIDASCLHMVTCRKYDEDVGNFLDNKNLVVDGHDTSLELFSRILRGLVALKFRGILAGGLSTRNFLLAEPEDEYKNPPELQQLGDFRVVMIGHGSNTVARYTVERRLEVQSLERPLHPVSDEFDPIRMHCLAGMYPVEWVRDIEPFFDWALKTFRSDDYTYNEAVQKRLDEIAGKQTED